MLNSALPGAPDADTQAIMMNLVDGFTSSHLRLLALWDNPPLGSRHTAFPSRPGHRPSGQYSPPAEP